MKNFEISDGCGVIFVPVHSTCFTVLLIYQVPDTSIFSIYSIPWYVFIVECMPFLGVAIEQKGYFRPELLQASTYMANFVLNSCTIIARRFVRVF